MVSLPGAIDHSPCTPSRSTKSKFTSSATARSSPDFVELAAQGLGLELDNPRTASISLPSIALSSPSACDRPCRWRRFKSSSSNSSGSYTTKSLRIYRCVRRMPDSLNSPRLWISCQATRIGPVPRKCPRPGAQTCSAANQLGTLPQCCERMLEVGFLLPPPLSAEQTFSLVGGVPNSKGISGLWAQTCGLAVWRENQEFVLSPPNCPNLWTEQVKVHGSLSN